MPRYEKISRRAWLKIIATTVSAAGAPRLLVASGNCAEVKVSQSMVHFQNHPNQRQMCGICMFFIQSGATMEAGTCKLVEGKISSKAWCILYAPK